MTRKHVVVTVEDLDAGKFKEEAKAKEKVFCKEHQEEPLKHFCTVCKIPICRDCKTYEHDDHKCVPMGTIAEETKPKLQKLIKTLKSKLPIYSDIDNTFNSDLDKLDIVEKSVNSKIETRINEVVDLVRKRGQKLKNEVNEMASVQRKQIKASQERFQLTASVIRSTTEMSEKVLQNGKDAEILLLQQQMETKLQELQNNPIEEIPDELKLEFKQDKELDKNMAINGLGNISRVKVARNVNIQPQIKASQDTDSSLRDVVSELKGMKVGSVDVKMMKETGKAMPRFKDKSELKLSFKPGVNCCDVFVNSDSHMIVTGGNEVQIFDKTGKLKTSVDVPYASSAIQLPGHGLRLVVSTSHFYESEKDEILFLSSKKIISKIPMPGCRGLALSKCGQRIAVGCVKHNSWVTLLSTDGSVIRKIDKYNGKALFESPCYVAFTSQGNIVVSDYSKHCITVLSPDGVPQFTYGREGSGNGELRYPHGVCMDAYDNIIIADRGNKRIHLVTNDGKFVKYLVTEQDGLRCPSGVAVNNDGELVVVDDALSCNGMVKVFKYLD